MENPQPRKVAKVAEIREKFDAAEAVLITEYRGLTVSDMADLRSAMRSGGGEYKIYKNTLVRIAIDGMDLGIDDHLGGPTAIAFVTAQADGTPGDVASVAKALRDFAKQNELLVIKGGLLGEAVLDEADVRALASLPTASEIYSRLAGAINSGARGVAGSVSGIHRSLVYVLQAAIDGGNFAGDSAPAPAADASDGAPGDTSTEAEAEPESSVAVDTEEEPAADAAPESAEAAQAPAEAAEETES